MSAGLLLVVETRWAFLIEETYEHYFSEQLTSFAAGLR